MLTRRQLIAAAIAPAAFPAHALDPFPERTLKMVVPFAAGGGTDIVARLVAVEMGRQLGQPVVVDNRAGAAGGLGSGIVATSPPDGYTLLMATVSTHALNPVLYAHLPYDPIKSFAPVSLVARVGGVVVVKSTAPYQSLKQLAEAMRHAPGRLTFGSQGVGGIGHLMGEMFNSEAGTKSTHVPYKGVAPALQDLLAGNIDIIYDTVPALLPYIRSGKLRALAVTTPQRLENLPETPTAAEAGYPQFLAETWNALLVPAQTPPQVVARLSEAAVQAVKVPAVQQRFEELCAVPVGSSAEQLGQFMRDELKRWAPIVSAAGVKLE